MSFKPRLALILYLIQNVTNMKLSMFNNAVQVHLPVTELNEYQEKKSQNYQSSVEETESYQSLPETDQMSNNNQYETSNEKFDYFVENVYTKGIKYIKFLNSYNLVQDVTYTIHNEFSSAFWYKVAKIDGVNMENSYNGISLAKPITRQGEVRVYDNVIQTAKEVLGAIVNKYVSAYERGNFLRSLDMMYKNFNEADNGKRKSIRRLRFVTTHKRDFKQYITHILSVIKDIDEKFLSTLVLTAIMEFQKLNLTSIMSDRCENNLKNKIASEVNAYDVNFIREYIKIMIDTFNGNDNLHYKNVTDIVNNKTKINKDWDRYVSALKEWTKGQRMDIKKIVRKWYHHVLNETVGKWDEDTKVDVRNQIENLVYACVAGVQLTTESTTHITVK